jgi:outer membrane murein-binding lipoprotein Lpp
MNETAKTKAHCQFYILHFTLIYRKIFCFVKSIYNVKCRIYNALPLVFVLILAGCQNAPTNSNQNLNVNTAQNLNANTAPVNQSNNANQTKSDTHEHTAPHGGTLIVFGEEFAHLELVLDASNGALTAYALDGEAEKSVQIAQTEIEIEIEKPKKFSVKLAAQENALTGEKKGATSEFRAASDELKNLNEFDAKIKSITIRGREFKNTHFNFPKGNEGGHKH